ncbi:G protein pathway suppressor 2 [Orchesella cincta]|uniref:G protein pathway suppressor 2 n=1 Tax=Orchesella cincta TaxID=48709 RepID=A0A1D2MLW8_ORCCI|nr:G protein pathway suppressor 2 [Orchesella cincta]
MPPVVLERPKMSRQMWESLKSQIVRERQRKQQELEADAEVERQRKERERQQKQDSMTLSETREQIAALEGRLSELKDEKHQVFMQLKKVLNEDEVRKRQLISQEQTRFDMGRYLELGKWAIMLRNANDTGGPQMFLQQVTLTRPPTAVYKGVPVSHQPAPHSSHTLLPPGGLKRSRSPSPPLHQSNNYKFGPFKPPPHALHSYPHKPGPVGALQFFPSQAIQQQPPHTSQPSFSSGHHQPPPQQQQQQQQHNNSTTTTATTTAATTRYGVYIRWCSTFKVTSVSISSRKRRTTKAFHHLFAAYSFSTSRIRDASSGRSMFELHLSHQHTPPPQKFGDDSPKYYPPPTHSLPIRSTHMTIHPALSIQASQGISTGSITSGFPIRTQPSVTSFQGRPPSPHITYTGPGGPPRLSYGHPHSAHIQTSAPHPNAPRYNMPPGMQRDRD